MRRPATPPVLTALFAALLAAVPAGSTAAAGPGTDAGPVQGRHGTLLDSVPRSGTLRVCTTGDYRPFTHQDPRTGAYSGIDVDMARGLAASLDAEPAFVPTTWAELVADVAAGRCDIGVGGVSVTLPRAREVYFSEPYLTDGKTPIVRCGEEREYWTLERIDRPGVRVVVNPGGTNEEFVRTRLEQAEVTVHPDNTTIFDEIAEGRADVMITDASETRYQAGIREELCAVHPEEPFTFTEKAYALPRGDEEFKEYVDQWVHLARHDGTYEEYEREWGM